MHPSQNNNNNNNNGSATPHPNSSIRHNVQTQHQHAQRPVSYTPTAPIASRGGISHSITSVAPSVPRASAAPAMIPAGMTTQHQGHQRMAMSQQQQQQHIAVPTQPSYHHSATPRHPPPSSGWSVPNPLSAAPAPQPPPPPRQPNQPQQRKSKVVLSPQARQALARAIWSAIQSPTGEVDPQAMQLAVKAGLPKHAILNAAKVAREREAIKRKAAAAQQQQQQQQQTHRHPSAQHHIQQQHHRQHPHPQHRPVVQHQPRHVPPPQPKPIPRPVSVSKTAPVVKQQQSQKTLVGLAVQRKAEERTHWKRVHGGVFCTQKSRYLALPHSIPAMVRASPYTIYQHVTSQRRISYEKAKAIKQALLEQPPIPLKDPERFKRIKMEPKRVSKQLERQLKKARQSTQEALLKKLKDVHKSLMGHQSDFVKYHKHCRSELSKLAKTIRDRSNKKEHAKRKEEDQAERARLAALKANDMAAYKSLLADTKNERLQYLWNKTDECLEQISSLLSKRNSDKSSSSEEPSSYYATAHFQTEEVRQPSILVGGDLKEYQLAGLQWLVSLFNNKLNGILADEMGLGKTIQAISLVSYLMEYKENLGPYLIIVPLSTLSNWVNEFAKWCPSARVIIYKGNPAQRRELFKAEVRNGQFNVLLTTYEYIIKDKGSLKKLTWQYAIVDEGHRMKNSESKFAVTLGTVYTTKNRILLTGTPLQNNLPELWALLNFLLPSIFNSVESFDQWFNRPFSTFANQQQQQESEEGSSDILSNEERMLIIHRLHELLRPFMLRRVKSEVLDQLPEKVEKVLRCDLSSWQKELYRQISQKATIENKLDSIVEQTNARGLNNVVMQLRKVCNHPFLFSPAGYHINDTMIRSSGKLELLDRMLPKLKAAGHRVLMFTQMTAVMSILEDYFMYRGYSSLRLDGSTPAEEREKRMYKFNAPDSPYFIFLLSTRAGGLGLNLATADVVIIFDSDWNPMMDLQAQDRAHRIGQRNDVSVFRLVTYSPVEEKILSRATEKLNMSELVVEAGKFDKSSVEKDNSMERKRMMEVLLTDFSTSAREKRERKEGSEDGEDDEESAEEKEDLNELLSNTEADYNLYCKLDEDRVAAALRPGLFTSEDDVPDWIKYPQAGKKTASSAFDPNTSRKRKAVIYDDGLTEKQFLRLMDKQSIAEEERKKRLKADRKEASSVATESLSEPSAPPATVKPGTMTEWTFRKLINTCKSVIALKDPATKRRLSDIFLEKPCANTYPDYYQIIERPIAVNDILRKCRGHLYASLTEFWDDWKLLFANAKKYNGDGSWVVTDALALQRELERVMKKQGFEDQPPPRKKPLRIKLSLKKVKKNGEDVG